MEFFLWVILIVFLFYQNSRIKGLEKFLSGKSLDQVKPIINPSTNNTSEEKTVGNKNVEVAQSAEKESIIDRGISASDIMPSSEDASGKLLGRIGIGALIIGISFFLKYAFDNNWIGPAGRVFIGILIGSALLALGQWLRKKYLSFSDLLMGGGLVTLYLSIYSAYAFYQLIDPMLALMFMIVVTAIGAAISIINATPTLSILAMIGGFSTPFMIGGEILMSTWIVFTYVTSLNIGMLAVLMYKKWNHLIVICMFGTVLHYGTWFSGVYNDNLLYSALSFVILQFLIFTGATIARILIEKTKVTENEYFIMVMTAFGLALINFELLSIDHKHLLSSVFVIVAVFYSSLAYYFYKTNFEDKNLRLFFAGLAITFLTVVIPIESSGSWLTIWWFAEAVLLYTIAAKITSRGLQVAGLIVYILGLLNLVSYLVQYNRDSDYVIFFNAQFLMMMFAVLVSYVIYYTYRMYGKEYTNTQKASSITYVLIANVITVCALTSQVVIYYKIEQEVLGRYDSGINNMSHTTVSILWALYATALTVVGFVRKIPSARALGLMLFIFTALKVFIDVWSLGEIYRIISFIAFGIIALAASFMYVKYKDRLKEIL